MLWWLGLAVYMQTCFFLLYNGTLVRSEVWTPWSLDDLMEWISHLWRAGALPRPHLSSYSLRLKSRGDGQPTRDLLHCHFELPGDWARWISYPAVCRRTGNPIGLKPGKVILWNITTWHDFWAFVGKVFFFKCKLFAFLCLHSAGLCVMGWD